MMKYRKKPLEIEAVALTEETFTDEHPSDRHIKGVTYNPVEKVAYIETPTGTGTVRLGDYIIIDSQGGIHPCERGIFHSLYEPISGDYKQNPQHMLG